MERLYCVCATHGQVNQSIKISTFQLDYHEDRRWYFDHPAPKPDCCRLIHGLGYLEDGRVVFHDQESYPLEQWTRQTKTADEYVFWTTDAKRTTVETFSWLESQLQAVSKKLAEQVA